MKEKKRALSELVAENKSQMKKRPKADLRKLAVWLTPAEDAAVLQESKVKRRVSKQDWIAEAVREKLHKLGHEPEGPLSKLSPEDRRRIERYIELLKTADDDAEFKEAIDANCGLFERVLRTITKA